MNKISLSKQGNGFNHEAGLSNNAISAQANGLIPGSTELRKKLIQMGLKGIPQRFLTAHAPSCEYHHHGMAIAGGKYIKAVKYYNVNEVVEWLQLPQTKDAIRLFKAGLTIGATQYALIDFKEYKTLGAYNSKSLHLVRVLASLEDVGSQWSITIMSNAVSQRCVWQNSRYGRSSSDYIRCSWYVAGDSLRKNKDNVDIVRSISNEEMAEMVAKEKKMAALKKRIATIEARKAAAAAAAAQAEESEAQRLCDRLLSGMEPQIVAAGADYKRKSCAWFIYSKFFEGNPSTPEFVTCRRIRQWLKSKVYEQQI